MTEQTTTTAATGGTSGAAGATPETAPGTAPDGIPEAVAAPAPRRALRAVLRWTAAVLAFAAAGTGAAYGLLQPERTDIPGLATRTDGRWTYPALAKPTLPPGAALPFAEDNADGIHYAGLTQLLLPAPLGSSPDPALKVEKDSVVAVDTFLEEYEGTARQKMKQGFTDNGLRGIVGRGWTTPDGVRTRVYLLRFHASGLADTFKGCGAEMNLIGVNRMETDGLWRKARLSQDVPVAEEAKVLEESVPFGDEQIRAGCIGAGDIQAVILQSRRGATPAIPLHQAVVLQGQLLH
ncbi:hypothetical protein AB4039_26615 [Streptomyces sp. M-16]|uniref:hypothetical protein n=1 Tax=Streptomyces sp. M-16 TaxID=3233040 RepID=UPI0022576D98